MHLTAVDVINQFLEFQQMVPDKKMWNEKSLQDNPPRFYRFKRLRSLFHAFNLGNLTEFETGNFLLNKSLTDYQFFIERAKNDLETENYHLEINSLSVERIGSCFVELLAYRKNIYTLLSFNKGILSASNLYYYACIKTEHFNGIINSYLPLVDEILELLISPERLSFSESYLIEYYGYPDVNLQAIDDDWV